MPRAMGKSGSPFSGEYSYPQPLHTAVPLPITMNFSAARSLSASAFLRAVSDSGSRSCFLVSEEGVSEGRIKAPAQHTHCSQSNQHAAPQANSERRVVPRWVGDAQVGIDVLPRHYHPPTTPMPTTLHCIKCIKGAPTHWQTLLSLRPPCKVTHHIAAGWRLCAGVCTANWL